MKTITTILFDLGGVLVELGGISTMHSWMGETYNDEKLMELWLASKNVREFESGNASTESFVRNILDAASVLFFDNSPTNVTAAKAVGLKATQVVGFKALETVIRSRKPFVSDG